MKRPLKLLPAFLTVFALFFLVCQAPLAQEEPSLNMVPGPTLVDLGNNIAEIKVPEGYVFSDADDTKKLLEMMGNPPGDNEVGAIFPQQGDQNWFLIFEYEPTGYVKDDEKDDIDADALLENVKKGTAAANEYREERGISPVFVKGWYKRPYYDESTHNLAWAIEATSEDGASVNYNTRILGRKGVMSVILVCDPSEMESSKMEMESMLDGFSYKKGQKYSEYVQGDKIAKYGLTALIAGGAGVAAAKLGLLGFLAKFWKVIVAGIGAFFVAIRKKLAGLFGKK